MAHTPRPWTYEIIPSDAEERSQPAAEWTGLYIGPEDDEGSMLHTIFEGGFAHGPEDGDPEDDARLIAAAPDLLEALERLVQDYQDVPDATDTNGQAVFEQARAAIARARNG